MPTPIAHGLMGAITLTALRPDERTPPDWKMLLIGCGLGVAPDLDVLLCLLWSGNREWHHDFMHSIAFAFLTGWIVAWRLKRREWKTALIFGTAMMTHPLLDFIFTSSDGVELFWPLSEQRFRLGSQGFGVYHWHHHSLTGRLEDLLGIVIIEFMFYGAVLAAVLHCRGRLIKTRSLISQE
jgi:membrane-bound metal-dependent hydrolase YbcI (DUF457 family)